MCVAHVNPHATALLKYIITHSEMFSGAHSKKTRVQAENNLYEEESLE